MKKIFFSLFHFFLFEKIPDGDETSATGSSETGEGDGDGGGCSCASTSSRGSHFAPPPRRGGRKEEGASAFGNYADALWWGIVSFVYLFIFL